MKVVYTLESIVDSANTIFLAGPTHRIAEYNKNDSIKSWREAAIAILEKSGFDGIVYAPEWRNNLTPFGWTYSRQVSWEMQAMEKASVLLFWVPRNLKTLPAFTTNIEFGEWFKSGKIVIGSPEHSPKNEYLKERCAREYIIWCNTLEDCVTFSLDKLKELTVEISKIWFTADTHFGDQRTLELSRRPFSSCLDMDNSIIKEWNSVIKENDIVYHLGDFGNIDVLKRLNCKKLYLLPGNYDTNICNTLDTRLEIISSNHLISYIGMTFRLVHAPEDSIGVGFYLFGHIHKLQMIKQNGINVGVDCHNFKPIDWSTILFYRNAIEKHYDKNVFLDILGGNIVKGGKR